MTSAVTLVPLRTMSAVVLADDLEQFLVRDLRPDVHLDPGALGQHLQAFLGEFVGDQEFSFHLLQYLVHDVQQVLDVLLGQVAHVADAERLVLYVAVSGRYLKSLLPEPLSNSLKSSRSSLSR